MNDSDRIKFREIYNSVVEGNTRATTRGQTRATTRGQTRMGLGATGATGVNLDNQSSIKNTPYTIIQQLGEESQIRAIKEIDTRNIINNMEYKYGYELKSISNLHIILTNNNTEDDIDISTIYSILQSQEYKAFNYDINTLRTVIEVCVTVMTECLYDEIDTKTLQGIALRNLGRDKLGINGLMYFNLIRVITTIGINTVYLLMSIRLGDNKLWPFTGNTKEFILQSISNIKNTTIASILRHRCTSEQIIYIKILNEAVKTREIPILSTEEMLRLSKNYVDIQKE